MDQEFLAMMKREQKQKARNYRELNRGIQKGQILFTGSSLMEQFPVVELAETNKLGKVVYNRGIGGTTTEDFLEEIDAVLLDPKPAKVFLNIGTNDIREWADGRDWLDSLVQNYDKILSICKSRLPDAEVYLMAYYPVNVEVAKTVPFAKEMIKVRTNENVAKANKEVERLAEKYQYHYINVNEGLSDESGNLKAEYTVEGIHMYANAYKIVYQNLLKYL